MPLFGQDRKTKTPQITKHSQRSAGQALLAPLKKINNSLQLSTRFLIVIVPLLILIFAVSTYVIFNKRRADFDKQLNILESTFSRINKQNITITNKLYFDYHRSLSVFIRDLSWEALSKKDLKALKQYSDLVFARDKASYTAFYDISNNLLVSSGKRNQGQVFQKIKINHQGKDLGTLMIGFPQDAVKRENQGMQALANTRVQKMKMFLRNAQIENTYAAMFAMFMILTVIVLSISVMFSYFISKPLSRCIRLIRRFQSRDYDAEIPYLDQRDEIGEIARTLETFRSSLKNIERLEKEKATKNLQLIEARAEAERLAFTDELTGLPNKACCQLDANAMISNLNPEANLSVLYLDLNDIKKVNDTLGHAAGDCLLLEVSKSLSALTSRKQSSQVYRWGGDEFVIIYDHSSGPIEVFCNEVKEALHHPVQYGTSTLWPSCSFGISNYPSDGGNFEELMICADLALHQSHKSSKGGFCFFTKELKQKIDEESRIEAELRVAIENRQLFMAFQPQIDSKTLEVRGMEALIRWNHPERGILSPYHFLDVIENSRLAPVVGRYVFNEAFRAARYWLDNDIQFGRISVNLSPQHLKQGTLVEDLKNCMKKNNLSPDYVTVEILESLLIDENDDAQHEFMAELSNTGVKVELDDFGTGYASLSHLSTLAIDGLKIDRSFTKMLMLDPKKTVVIQSLVSLCRLLQIDLVCEGVETWPQMEKLRSFGTCSLQGYLIAKPLDFETITQWLKEEKNYNFLNELNHDADTAHHG